MTASVPSDLPDYGVWEYTILMAHGQTIIPSGFRDVTPEPPAVILEGTLKPRRRWRHVLNMILTGKATIREDEME